MLAMIIPLMALVSTGLTTITVLVPFPPVLAGAATGGQPALQGLTPTALVQNNYLAHVSALLISLVVAGIVVGLLMLVISGRMTLGRRRWPSPGGLG
jgi:hypothetical protein